MVLILPATGITNLEKLYHFTFNMDVEKLLLSLILRLPSKVRQIKRKHGVHYDEQKFVNHNVENRTP